MAARSLVFAAFVYNLAETTRMLEIARAVTGANNSEHRFDVQFISDGGEFEGLIENAGFPTTTAYGGSGRSSSTTTGI